MKKLCLILAVLFLLAPGSSVRAENGVNVEVMKVNGESVVVLTPESTMLRARSIAKNAPAATPERNGDFTLPQYLTLIEESAFEGIKAESIEISENVVSIERRAFADCKQLRDIHIPETVLKVDDHALDGCEHVTVYGVAGSEAERFAKAAGFTFVDQKAEQETPEQPIVKEKQPAELPLVARP